MNYKENEVISVDEQSLESVKDIDSYIKGTIDGAKLKTQINWKQKLSSRKLWAAIVGVVVGIAAAFGLNENDYAQIAGVITSLASIIAYIFGESNVDKARIEGESIKGIIDDAEKAAEENEADGG